MSTIKKAGIPFYVKVDTQKDLIGKSSGFKVEYINDATGEATEVDTTFEEVIKAIQDFSTIASQDVTIGSKEVLVKDASGFAAGDVVKINGNYYYIDSVDTDNNVITLAKTLETAVSSGDNVVKVGNTGIYRAKVVINEPGDYTFVISNYAEGMQNVAFPVTIEKATIDDVKALLDEVKPEIDDIKAQVDTLDEEEFNNLHEEIVELSNHVQHLADLVSDVTVTVSVSGDITGSLEKGMILKGSVSASTGQVLSFTYDSDNDVTNIILENVKGEFDTTTPDHLEDEDGNDLGAITSASKASSNIDSIMEFVEKLKEELEDSANGLDAIITVGKNIQHLINGDDTLEDGSVCPTAGKGLVAIFDEIVNTHNDVSDIKVLATNAIYGFEALRNAIDDARSSIEAKINALTDESDENSLASKLNAIKAVVDANEALLENDTYGLSALKDLLDNDMSTIISRFDTLDSTLNNISNKIDAQTAHIDNRFDDVMNKLNTMQNERKFIVFA